MRLLSCARTLAIAAISLPLTGCSDVVTTHYDTLAQYEDRGWLPADLLPSSTHDITTSNDLDANHSSGEFSFDPDETAALLVRMKTGAPVEAPYENWNALVRRHRASGRKAWTYDSEGSRWVFFCDEDDGYCKYEMWDLPPRTAAKVDVPS